MLSGVRGLVCVARGSTLCALCVNASPQQAFIASPPHPHTLQRWPYRRLKAAGLVAPSQHATTATLPASPFDAAASSGVIRAPTPAAAAQLSGCLLYDSGSCGLTGDNTRLSKGDTHFRSASRAAAAYGDGCDGLCCLAEAVRVAVGGAAANASHACCCEQAAPARAAAAAVPRSHSVPSSSMCRLLRLAAEIATNPQKRCKVLLSLRIEIDRRCALGSTDATRAATLARLREAIETMLEKGPPEPAPAPMPAVPCSPSVASAAPGSPFHPAAPVPQLPAMSPPPKFAQRTLFPPVPAQRAALPSGVPAFATYHVADTEPSPRTGDSHGPAKPVRPAARHGLPPALLLQLTCSQRSEAPLPHCLAAARRELLRQTATACGLAWLA